MSHKQWVVDLTQEERAELEALTRRGTAPVRKVAHARVLLLAADGHTDDQIAVLTGRSRSLVERTRKRFVLSGLEAALWDRPRPGSPAKLDEHGRATLIALAAPTRLLGGPAGPCSCWPTSSSLGAWWARSRTRRSVASSRRTGSNRGSRSTGASPR